jgi:hypothetical protein
MFKTLSQGVGFALSLVTLLGSVHGEIPFPEQCWPDCNAYLENQECQAWFGPSWYYCGWANGWTYCCGGE